MVDPQPSIHLAGIRIDEPMTAFTDLVVSAVCLYAFFQLTRQKLPGKTLQYLRIYFLLMGIAVFLGGLIGHAFLYAFGFSWKLPGWILSMFSVALIERSSIEYAKPLIKPGIGKFFLVLNIVELTTIMSITMYTLNFKWVEFHSGYGLLGVVLPFHLYTYYRTKDVGSLYMMVAVGIATVAALIFMNKISIHMWFNYLDISHTLMATAAFVFYKGALLLDRN